MDSPTKRRQTGLVCISGNFSSVVLFMTATETPLCFFEGLQRLVHFHMSQNPTCNSFAFILVCSVEGSAILNGHMYPHIPPHYSAHTFTFLSPSPISNSASWKTLAASECPLKFAVKAFMVNFHLMPGKQSSLNALDSMRRLDWNLMQSRTEKQSASKCRY